MGLRLRAGTLVVSDGDVAQHEEDYSHVIQLITPLVPQQRSTSGEEKTRTRGVEEENRTDLQI